MLDPIVAPYDVAALQVLFDETPGAVFTTLHGHVGPSRHRFGTAVGACSSELAAEVVERYGAWARSQPVRLPKGATSTQEAFVETHALAAERTPGVLDAGPGSATAAWTLALEKGVARFRHEHPGVHVEDVSLLVSWEESVSASVKNGALSTAPKLHATLGVHVRAVVEGGCGLRVASLPLEGAVPEGIVSDALEDALRESRSSVPPAAQPKPSPKPHEKMPREILAWRDPLVGHFGPDAWDASLDFGAFRSILAHVSEFADDAAGEIQTVSVNVGCASHKRLQVFLDGAQQTLSGVRFRVGGSVTARRGDEKRAADFSFFENGIPNLARFKGEFGAKLKVTKERARALLDAPLVPEDVSYSHLAVDADLLGLILHEALGHAAEGDAIELGSSGFGRPRDDDDPRYTMQDINVAPPWIDIVIDGALDTCGLLPIDCEGTPPVRKTIVRAGRLVDGLHTRQTARSAGRTPDGCARQESIFHPSMNRMTSIWVQAQGLRPLPFASPVERVERPSAEAVQAVLESDGFLTPHEPVLYLSGWKGGTATCSNLEFRADVAFIHELRRGQPPRLLREANFTGIATDCFLSAVAAYGPVLCRTIGTCGKDSQLVPTSDGGPAVLVLAKTPRVTVIGSGDSEE
jgi:predicted Zn-dependent protease